MPYTDPIPALKRQLGNELARLIADWDPDNVAATLHTDRRRIFEIRRGTLTRFSLEALIRFLARLRRVVDLNVRDAPPTYAHPPHHRARDQGALDELD